MRVLALALTVLVTLLPLAVRAECVGQNLLDAMPEAERQALTARSHAAPFATGNLWRATKGGHQITLVGTYHIDDPRHAETLARLGPIIEEAALLLVEAGPEEMSSLQDRLMADPGLMVTMNGPALPDRLAPELWAELSAAMQVRGVPPMMAARMKPWYLTMLLSIPPCALEVMGEDRGLDAQVIEAATARNLPIRGLEPYDTVFHIFDQLSEADQLSMIASTLALEDQSEDMSVTMADAYFDEESRLIWEFTRDQTAALPGFTADRVEREFAAMEKAMMTSRNRAWIPVLTGAAQDGPVLAAFGALHLSGGEGVLALLQAEGYALERLDFR